MLLSEIVSLVNASAEEYHIILEVVEPAVFVTETPVT